MVIPSDEPERGISLTFRRVTSSSRLPAKVYPQDELSPGNKVHRERRISLNFRRQHFAKPVVSCLQWNTCSCARTAAKRSPWSWIFLCPVRSTLKIVKSAAVPSRSTTRLKTMNWPPSLPSASNSPAQTGSLRFKRSAAAFSAAWHGTRDSLSKKLKRSGFTTYNRSSARHLLLSFRRSAVPMLLTLVAAAKRIQTFPSPKAAEPPPRASPPMPTCRRPTRTPRTG